MYITIQPALGREYKTAKAAKADWASGKDFVINCLGHPDDGRFVNLEDAQKSTDIFKIRFCGNRKTCLAEVSPITQESQMKTVESVCPHCGNVNELAHEVGAVDGPREYHAECWAACNAKRFWIGFDGFDLSAKWDVPLHFATREEAEDYKHAHLSELLRRAQYQVTVYER